MIKCSRQPDDSVLISGEDFAIRSQEVNRRKLFEEMKKTEKNCVILTGKERNSLVSNWSMIFSSRNTFKNTEGHFPPHSTNNYNSSSNDR